MDQEGAHIPITCAGYTWYPFLVHALMTKPSKYDHRCIMFNFKIRSKICKGRKYGSGLSQPKRRLSNNIQRLEYELNSAGYGLPIMLGTTLFAKYDHRCIMFNFKIPSLLKLCMCTYEKCSLYLHC